MNIPFETFRPPGDPAELGRAWHDHLAPVYDVSYGRHTDLSVPPRMVTSSLGPLLFGWVAAPSQQNIRSPRMVADAGADHVVMQFYRDGATRVELGEHVSEVRAGQIFVADMAQPILTQTEGAAAVTAVNLVVPRRLLGDRATAVENLHGASLPSAAAPARQLLFSYVSDLADHLGEVEAGQAKPLSAAAVDLVRSCFLPGEAPSKTRRQLRKVAVRRFVEDHLASHGLDVTSLAERFGLSRASLQRMFAQEGGVGAYIRGRRLLRGRHLLTERSGGGHSVSQVAYRVGFESLETFSRAFHRRFGLSPTELARSGGPHGSEKATSDLIASYMRGFVA